MDPRETTVTTTTTTRTTETPISPQIPPLDDGNYSVPAWANKVVDEIAGAGREPSARRKALRVTRLAMVLFAFVGLTFLLILTVYWLGQPYGKPVVEFDDGINILRPDGTPGAADPGPVPGPASGGRSMISTARPGANATGDAA